MELQGTPGPAHPTRLCRARRQLWVQVPVLGVPLAGFAHRSQRLNKSLEQPLVRLGFPRAEAQEAETAGASSEPGRSRARPVSLRAGPVPSGAASPP